METAPFFVVGSGRSGSTLLQLLIDAHPNIAIPPESHVYHSFGPVFESYGDLTVVANRRRFIRALLRDAFIREWHLDATVHDVEDWMERPDRGGVIDALFKLYAQRHGAQRWGDKTPEHVRHLAAIRRDFPDAKLIHLVRDGRDVAEAYRRMVFGSYSAVGLARDWRDDVMSWQAFCAEHGAANTLVVRYEDLVSDTLATVSGVFDFLGEPAIDTVTGYADTPLGEAMGAMTAVHSSLRQGISTSKVGVYRTKLSRRDIEVFEAVAGDALAAYGYERDFAAPQPATALERLSGVVADRVVRWYRKLLRHPDAIWMAVQRNARLARRLFPRTVI